MYHPERGLNRALNGVLSVALGASALTACSKTEADLLSGPCDKPNIAAITDAFAPVKILGILQLEDDARIRTTTDTSTSLNISHVIETSSEETCKFVPLTRPLKPVYNGLDGIWWPADAFDLNMAGIATSGSGKNMEDPKGNTYWVAQRGTTYCMGPEDLSRKGGLLCKGAPWPLPKTP